MKIEVTRFSSNLNSKIHGLKLEIKNITGLVNQAQYTREQNKR